MPARTVSRRSGQSPDARRASCGASEAFDVAWRCLGHRDRTEAELVRAVLKRSDVEPELDRGGPRRAARGRLRRRRRRSPGASPRTAATSTAGARSGSSAACASSAWTASTSRRRWPASEDHERARGRVALLARRFPTPPETPRDRDRALGFLVRKGYELELAHDALRRHARASTLDSCDSRSAGAIACGHAPVLRSAAATDRVRSGPLKPAANHPLSERIQQLQR